MINMSFIILEGNYDTIDTDDSSYHGYYTIDFSSYPYNLQVELIIDGQGIYYIEMVCEGTYLFTINIISRYLFLQKLNPLTQLFF